MQELMVVQASCAVADSAPGVGAPVVFTMNNGFNETTSLHPATGVWDLDLDTPLNLSQCAIVATLRTTAPAGVFMGVSHTSDVRKRVNQTGSEEDTPFDLVVFRRPAS